MIVHFSHYCSLHLHIFNICYANPLSPLKVYPWDHLVYMMNESVWQHFLCGSMSSFNVTRKSLSLQSVSDAVVREIRKLLLVHPMLVLATKSTNLWERSSTEVKRWIFESSNSIQKVNGDSGLASINFVYFSETVFCSQIRRKWNWLKSCLAPLFQKQFPI